MYIGSHSILLMIQMPIVSMSVTDQTLKKFDDTVKRLGYTSRSEAFRDAMQEFVSAGEWRLPEGRTALILAILYERGEPKVQLSILRHKYEEIKTMLHTHLDEVNCLELLIAEGVNNRLKEIVKSVRRIRGVKQLKFISTVSEI